MKLLPISTEPDKATIRPIYLSSIEDRKSSPCCWIKGIVRQHSQCHTNWFAHVTQSQILWPVTRAPLFEFQILKPWLAAAACFLTFYELGLEGSKQLMWIIYLDSCAKMSFCHLPPSMSNGITLNYHATYGQGTLRKNISTVWMNGLGEPVKECT